MDENTKFSSVLQDNSGGFSAYRLAYLVWLLGSFLVWSILSFKKGEFIKIDESFVLLVVALTTGKVIQRFGENNPK